MSERKISEETKAEAMKIARGTQKPGQTKEQTKLIAQGIEKGIAEYKKQQKVKARERDKIRKKELKVKMQAVEDTPEIPKAFTPKISRWIIVFLVVTNILTLLYFLNDGISQ